MAEQAHQLVQKLWNYCNIVRDDLSAPDWELRSGRLAALVGRLLYLLAPGAQASGDYVEQLTFLLFRFGFRVS